MKKREEIPDEALQKRIPEEAAISRDRPNYHFCSPSIIFVRSQPSITSRSWLFFSPFNVLHKVNVLYEVNLHEAIVGGFSLVKTFLSFVHFFAPFGCLNREFACMIGVSNHENELSVECPSRELAWECRVCHELAWWMSNHEFIWFWVCLGAFVSFAWEHLSFA